MDLETFAEMQRRRIRTMPVERRRDIPTPVERIDIAVVARQLRHLDVITPQDPIRTAYRKLQLVYE